MGADENGLLRANRTAFLCAVGATESVSVNKAGMCWHITSGQGHSCQDWVAPQEYFIRSCPNSRNVFWDRSGFYFSLLSRKQGPACASGPERTSLMKTEANIPYKFYLEESELPTAWYNVRALSLIHI